MTEDASRDRRALVAFGALALAGCVPFWLLGAFAGAIPGFPSALPWSALGFVVPAAAAVAVAGSRGELPALWRTLDPRGVRWGWWLAASAAGLLPPLADAARGGPWTPPAPTTVAALAAAYLVGGLGEELGWAGFAQPRLLRLASSLPAAALALGAYWAAWHLIPFLQTGRPAWWVAAQSVQAVLLRCVIVGLVAASRGGTWVAVAAHAAANLGWSLAPGGGAHYDPIAADAVLVPLAAVSLILGTKLRVSRWG